jgi:hypothetical protein
LSSESSPSPLQTFSPLLFFAFRFCSHKQWTD